MNRASRLAILIALAGALVSSTALTGAAWAKPGKGHGQRGTEEYSGDGPAHDEGGLDVRIVITDGDIGAIRSYYAGHPYVPEGLPPGIAKNLARGKPLPPGIAKRYLPQPLYDRLPARPGCDWAVVGPHIVLIAHDSGLILDIAFDIF